MTQTGRGARKNGRKVEAFTGREHRIYRMRRAVAVGDQEPEERWVRFEMGGKKEVDSIVHRYGREVGFRCANAGQVAQHDLRARAAAMRRSALMYREKSAKERATAQSMLECYVLQHHPPEEPYCVFLNELRSELPAEEAATGSGASQYFQTRELMAPPPHLLVSYICHLRDGDVDRTAIGAPGINPVRGRQNLHSTIDGRLKSISGTLLEFGQPKLTRTSELTVHLEDWRNKDPTHRADAFIFEDTLPKLWDAVWSAQFQQNHKKKVECWARLLVQLAVIGRSSDVTDMYCPKNGSVKFPEKRSHYTDEGLPLWIGIEFLDWKGRKPKNKGQPYEIRIHANPKDLRFCPVHWLMEHWKLRTGDANDEQAPILESMSSETWRGKLTKLFTIVGEDGSSHSLRRAAAQWAARCGASFFVIKNVGRWESIAHVMIYLAEGRQLHEKKLMHHDGVDPIFEFWPFSSETMVSTLEITEDVVRRLGGHF